jgi:MFS family permease
MNLVEKSHTTSITNKLLAMKFFSEFILIYPITTIMYGTYGHVNAGGIGLILGLALASSVVLEIPTGILADKLPRKYVLLASVFVKILALTTWLTVPNFRGYLVAATLFALSDACESGTLQAYLYGALGEKNKKSFGKFWARISALVSIAYTVAYTLTSIVGIHYPLLIMLSILPCVIAFFIGISLPLDEVYTGSQRVRPKVFASAVGHIKKSPDLIKLIIGGIVIVALAEVIIEYISLYYNQVGVSVRLVPIMMAATNLLGAAAYWSLYKWDKLLNKFQLVLLVMVSGFFIISFSGGVIWAVIGVLIFTRYIRVLQVQYESNIQHLANDEARATISSIGSFASSLLGAIIMASIGLSATNNSIIRSMRIALLAGAFLYLIIQLVSQRRKTIIENPGSPIPYGSLSNEKPL